MKKFLSIVIAISMIALCGCTKNDDQVKALKICVDGTGFQETNLLMSAFEEKYPNIQVEIEVFPEVKINYDSNYMPSVDTDSLAEREAVLQQHRTALMAGSSDADLYIIGGGISQFDEFNGGALVQDPYDLMRNGVLGDLSGVLKMIEESDYLSSVFSEGQMDDVQYLVPLRVSSSGMLVNLDGNIPFEHAKTREEMLKLLSETYARELGNLSGICNTPVTALSYPVVNRQEELISLQDDNYVTAFSEAKEFFELKSQFPSDDSYYADKISRGDTLLCSMSNPLSVLAAAASDLSRYESSTNLACVPMYNEKDGITVEVALYAFAPASSQNLETATMFLNWLLSQDVQNGTIPIFSSIVSYPLKKGCAKNQLNQMGDYVLKCIGESALESLDEFETNVTDAKFASHYDYEMLSVLQKWQAQTVELDVALEELYSGWELYLDE